MSQGLGVVVVVLQLVVLAAITLVIWRLRADRRENLRRKDQLWESMLDELRALNLKMGASRAEAATYLQMVFAGVQGLARNLDAERYTSVEAQHNLERLQAALAQGEAARASDTAPDLAPLQPLMEPRPRIPARSQRTAPASASLPPR